ncbi:hypothetical protein NL676_013101 [Syzygium grande]|nr:hypothetical protein NL676_013101 [Syzygium grande]
MRSAPPHVVFLLLPLFALATSVHGADLNQFCGGTGNFTANGTYAASLSTLLASVAAAANADEADYGFYNLSAGRSPDAANVIALCRGDVRGHRLPELLE